MKIMMHILYHLVFCFFQCFSFEIMYIRLLTMYKTERTQTRTSTIRPLEYSSLWNISNKSLFLLIAHFVVTQRHSEYLKLPIHSILHRAVLYTL